MAKSTQRKTSSKTPKNRGSRPENAQASRTRESEQSAAEAAEDQTVPVVGIGASAGGIEAISRFFEAMPADSGSAIVIVMHLDPTRESKIAELFSSYTSMPVSEIEDGMRIEADHVYVIVPDKYLHVRDGRLHLFEPPEDRGHRHPVDELFRSLAADQRERAIAIVLSGTGTNGTDGLKEIRSQGGMILVQSPDTAKFDGMPRSAISADLADHILSPDKMPEALVQFLRHGYADAPDRLEARATNGASLDKVLEILHARSGADFRRYKRSTLGRRVHRRLGLKNIETLESYIAELRTNPEELAILIKDMLISVTGFFRDQEAWSALTEQVIAPLVADRKAGSALRIWVCGCATGEEAYSMAMAVTRQAEAAGKQFDLKVFATDAQDDNLNRARDGVYPQAAVESIPAEQRRRYFDQLDGSYRVKKELRDMVMFAPQNLLRDPPFSRMDLISCRNLLIYLEQKAQQHVIAMCHFALREGGYLFLGNAESVGRHDDLFETVSKKWRIYRRIGPTRHDILDFPLLGASTPAHEPDEPSPHPQQGQDKAVSELAQRALLAAYAPAAVLIDRKNRVLYFHGDTGEYLQQPTGEPTKDLLAMAREGLGTTLRSAIREASAGKKRVSADARLRQGRTSRSVILNVGPLSAMANDDRLLVSFEPAPAKTITEQTEIEREPGGSKSELRALQDELNATRAELQSTIEEMETSNEELKASNEEVTSMNEELQSTNEELETSKEELQSFNEELQTVNTQLQHKIKELEDTNNDLDNLLAGTEVATLFLDTNLAIKWFTPQTVALFDLQSSDIGRPIGHFARKFTDEDLVSDAEQVLDRLTEVDAEVRDAAGRWYMRRVLPYRTRDNHIDGVVITFTDITELKASAKAIDEARLYAEAIVETIREPLLVLDADLRVQSANDAFYETFRIGKRDTEDRLIYEIGDNQWNIPALRRLLTETLSQNRAFSGIEVEHDFHELGRRCMLLNGRKLVKPDGSENLILLAIEDITARKDADTHQQTLIHELNHRVKNLMATVQAVAAQTIGTAASLEDAGKAFVARLAAMAKAHDLMTRQNWSGADMKNIVEDVIAPYSSEHDCFRIKGPPLRLPPANALTIAMALHELCTNAAKYGALSTGDGRVDINWQLEGEGKDRRLNFRWTESGGPPVEPPSRKGFGSRLVERALAAELGGTVSVEYKRSGVVCTLNAPVPMTEDK